MDAALSVLSYSWLSIPAKKIVLLYLKIIKPIGEIVLTRKSLGEVMCQKPLFTLLPVLEFTQVGSWEAACLRDEPGRPEVRVSPDAAHWGSDCAKSPTPLGFGFTVSKYRHHVDGKELSPMCEGSHAPS